MAIQLFQEQIPFSSQRLNHPVSQNGAFTNPVIMPFAFDFTTYGNTLEIVIYIRNNSQQKVYKNVVIGLMKRTAGTPTPVVASLEESFALGQILNVNGQECPISWSVDQAPSLDPVVSIAGDNYYSNFFPIYNYNYIDGNGDYQEVESDSNINVKFSYGYDELSQVEWDKASSILAIPSIGTLPTLENPAGMYDISYAPVRMRINWKARTAGTTIRDYFINIAYEEEVTLGE